mmetsp:Transcript_46352/g.69016  ORF Transcript_46352/g.69016 Transcript_46352/m.69016 type:complete len:233 (-) Transcript_46352:769-1467(-)
MGHIRCERQRSNRGYKLYKISVSQQMSSGRKINKHPACGVINRPSCQNHNKSTALRALLCCYSPRQRRSSKEASEVPSAFGMFGRYSFHRLGCSSGGAFPVFVRHWFVVLDFDTICINELQLESLLLLPAHTSRFQCDPGHVFPAPQDFLQGRHRFRLNLILDKGATRSQEFYLSCDSDMDGPSVSLRKDPLLVNNKAVREWNFVQVRRRLQDNCCLCLLHKALHLPRLRVR